MHFYNTAIFEVECGLISRNRGKTRATPSLLHGSAAICVDKIIIPYTSLSQIRLTRIELIILTTAEKYYTDTQQMQTVNKRA